MSVELNWIAILLATLSTMVVGSLWYGPIFGKVWTKLANIKKDPNFKGLKVFLTYGSAFLASAVTAISLATVTFIMQDFFGGNSVVIALETGLILWAGLTAARFYVHGLFEQRRKKLTLLGISYELVTIVVMSLIIGLLPA